MLPDEVTVWSRRAIVTWYLSGVPLFVAIVTGLGALIGVNSPTLFGVALGLWTATAGVSIYYMRRETLAYNGMFEEEKNDD